MEKREFELKKTRKKNEAYARGKVVLSNYPGSNGGITLCSEASKMILGSDKSCSVSIWYTEDALTIRKDELGPFKCKMTTPTVSRIYCNLDDVFSVIGKEDMRIVCSFKEGTTENSVEISL